MPAELIRGSRFMDARGNLDFFNLFDMSEIVRMYRIMPGDITTIRAWQGHRNERKWFYCLSGSFVVNLIPLSEFTDKSSGIAPEIYTLHSNFQEILAIPGGYANGFKPLEIGSELLVFSDKGLEDSQADDFRFDLTDRPFIEPN